MRFRLTAATVAILLTFAQSSYGREHSVPGRELDSSEAGFSSFRDYEPMPLPQLDYLPNEAMDVSNAFEGGGKAPLIIAGNPGSRSPASNRIERVLDQESRGSEDYGKNNKNTIYHYTDSRVDTELMNDYPIRPTGWFTFTNARNQGRRCTAELISKSIIATAGHCVHAGGNKASGWIKSGTFEPGFSNRRGRYGKATARFMVTTNGWYNQGQLDKGYDVALVVLNKKTGSTKIELGSRTGWYSVCIANCLQNYWYLTQLGYPGNYYGGRYLTMGEHLEKSDKRDYVYGSGMEGGSSGGPHVANLGYLSGTAGSNGSWPQRNVLFAVTSWGYINRTIKLQGASPLSGPNNANNFKGMWNLACTQARKAHGNKTCSPL